MTIEQTGNTGTKGLTCDCYVRGKVFTAPELPALQKAFPIFKELKT